MVIKNLAAHLVVGQGRILVIVSHALSVAQANVLGLRCCGEAEEARAVRYSWSWSCAGRIRWRLDGWRSK